MEVLVKNLKIKYVLTCIAVTFVVSLFISLAPINVEQCKCGKTEETDIDERHVHKSASKHTKHRLAILVPFRDRFEELLIFAPHIKSFLDKQDINYHVFILNQIDKYRFNRASLINVGFLEVKGEFDYIAMHDVDLLPMNDQLKYYYPETGPLHISSPELHPRYHYPTFIGGILLVNRKHFLKVNGMSNKYWGWGLEDDEFYVRLKEAGLNVTRPPNLLTGIQSTFKHIHDRNHRKRDMAKCFNQREVTRKRDRQTGLNNVAYKIENTINAKIENTSITILNVMLTCDKSITPWCLCDMLNIVSDKKIKNQSNLKTNVYR
ncbi:beta-1,4-galactosyltransferase 7 [Copidosoma floridanum]|uniref:beta-1,4-galactosyltransferase 7 n=1 Tax=Copidosoma floridanum TaxID=29053 RepID=UPI0006C96B4F|nr:beta-1,4-galactosyltransferase 7 [Copidosoma floridanum]